MPQFWQCEVRSVFFAHDSGLVLELDSVTISTKTDNTETPEIEFVSFPTVRKTFVQHLMQFFCINRRIVCWNEHSIFCAMRRLDKIKDHDGSLVFVHLRDYRCTN